MVCAEPDEPTIVVEVCDHAAAAPSGARCCCDSKASESECCTIVSRDWKTVTISIRGRLIELRFKDTAFAALLAIVKILEPEPKHGDLRRKRRFLDADGKVLPRDTLLSYALTPGHTIELLGSSFVVHSTAPQTGTPSERESERVRECC